MHPPSGLAAPPPIDTAAPAALQQALSSIGLSAAALTPVWQNRAGGLTFSVVVDQASGSIDYFAKWNPAGSGESLADEAERLTWIQGRHPAPIVVDLVTVGTEEILLTRALPGESAVAPRWRNDPEKTIHALGVGLRKLHSVAIDDCPFDWGVEHRMRSAGNAIASPESAPSIEKLVLCQGDPCAPNTLLAADGSFLAHVDLARIGVADRWADLAVMSMSLEWNFRDYDEAIFWNAYGIEPDRERINFYRELWDAT